ncbi:SDR family NAD(P)-dependent oxidoreductase [Micromonospora sp. RL09-050-HVF-A]|nr:SDR family NAD(P)-dependent oxidoreductase [Micromonospora sp. RL09-050-HVF-A]
MLRPSPTLRTRSYPPGSTNHQRPIGIAANVTHPRTCPAGFHVLAGVRRGTDADAIRTTGVEPVILAITDAEQVAALAARVGDDPRTVHALVNNAGIPVNAPVEALPMAQWRRVFEVNLFGNVAVTQALLPAPLHGGGRVINISSIGGKAAMPTYGAYAGAAARWSSHARIVPVVSCGFSCWIQ